MSEYRTGIAKDIWLLLCKEGGKWTPDEVASELKIDREKARVTMSNMSARSGLLQLSKMGNRVSFGVTAGCKVPVGLTVRDLENVGAITE